jgi:hypothetical protein
MLKTIYQQLPKFRPRFLSALQTIEEFVTGLFVAVLYQREH